VGWAGVPEKIIYRGARGWFLLAERRRRYKFFFGAKKEDLRRGPCGGKNVVCCCGTWWCLLITTPGGKKTGVLGGGGKRTGGAHIIQRGLGVARPPLSWWGAKKNFAAGEGGAVPAGEKKLFINTGRATVVDNKTPGERRVYYTFG